MSRGYTRKPVKTILIINPSCRPRKIKKCLSTIVGILRDNNFSVDIYYTQGYGDATVAAREFVTAGYDMVIVLGGDGTVNEVINGIADYQVTLGIIPLGTSNVLARELKIPLDPLESTELIVKGKRKRCDLGKVGNRYFSLMVGCGFDAYTVSKTNMKVKKIFGRYAYILAGLYHILRYKPQEIQLNLDDGKVYESGTFVVISNAHFYGGEYELTPNAKIDDGYLDACVLQAMRIFRYFYFLFGLLRKKHLLHKDVRCYRFRRAELRSQYPIPLQADGDIIGDLPAEIEVIPKAIDIICP